MAKKPKGTRSDLETLDHFRNTRSHNLFRLQSHAFDHHEGVCRAVEGQIPNPPTRREMACPMCGIVKGFNDFNEEHAPQKGSQSKFGGPSCVVLTCSSCNGLAGRSFEARAARLGAGIEAPRAEVMYIRNDLQTGRLSIVGVDDQARTATDLKTAFLVAFAALGYRFAFAPAVKPVRRAILEGIAPAVGYGGPLPELDATWSPMTVYEVDKGFVVVVGRDSGWMLPAGNKPLPPIGGAAGSQAFGWPEIQGSGNWKETETHLSKGRLFHSDYCFDSKHEAVHGQRLQRSYWRV